MFKLLKTLKNECKFLLISSNIRVNQLKELGLVHGEI